MVPGISERTNGSTKFSHLDRLGTNAKTTDSSGTVVDSRRYDAFGLPISVTNPTNSQKGFASAFGIQEDPETGLKLMGHRYYDAGSGRFITRDRAGAGTNWYAYCDNNPLKAVDPDGYEKLIIVTNGDGTVTGTHTLVGLVDNNGNVIWYSFYPGRPPVGGRSSSGSSNRPGSSGSSHRPGSSSGSSRPTAGGGGGYVSNDPPGQNSTGEVFDINPEQYNKLKMALDDSQKRRRSGRGRPYDMKTYNCATYVADLISNVLNDADDNYPMYGGGRDGTSGKITLPNKYGPWTSANYPGHRGPWHPGEAIP